MSYEKRRENYRIIMENNLFSLYCYNGSFLDIIGDNLEYNKAEILMKASIRKEKIKDIFKLK